MTFSIIVPVYNVESYLEQCVESILAQTYPDYEVLLIDDGSTDASGSICDRYAAGHPFIRVIHQNNQGLSGARNRGLKAAKGDWIAFVDSDDWIEPDMLETLQKHIQKTGADVYSFNARKVGYTGEVIEKLLYAVEDDVILMGDEKKKFEYYFHDLMRYQWGWEVCFRIFRRKWILEHGLEFLPTQKVFAEDYLFTFQYLLYAEKVERICDILYNYRQREQSLMNSLDETTMLKRLFCWAEAGYEAVREAHLTYFCRNYYRLCFMLLNFHIQHKLSFSAEEVRQIAAKESAVNWKRKRWLNQMRRHQEDLERYMEKKKWLTKRKRYSRKKDC